MAIIFWLIDDETKIALVNFQWEHFKTKLNIPDEPKQEGHKPELEPEPDPELVREMQKRPHSPRFPR